MRKGTISIALILIALLSRPQAILAQTTTGPIKGSWDGLKSVPPGDELVVVLRNGQTIKGRLSSSSDTVLTLTRGKKTTDLNRGEVLKVYRSIPRSAKRSTMIGLAVGAGIGAGSGAAWEAGINDPNENYATPVLALLGAGIGALAGYLVGSRKHRALIYETN